MNKVILIGNLGKDPDVITMSNGKQLAKLSLATSESYTNHKGEKVTNTQWHSIVMFEPLAAVAEKYLKKGDKICVVGQINYRDYEAPDGTKKYFTEITAREMEMLGGSKREETTSSPTASRSPAAPNPPQIDNQDETDDLPF